MVKITGTIFFTMKFLSFVAIQFYFNFKNEVKIIHHYYWLHHINDIPFLRVFNL